MSPKSHRLEFLDSIRGLAALAVLLSHTVQMFGWPSRIWHLQNLPFINIPFNGGEAVVMFFVLSGFLLSRPLFLPPKDGQPPRKLHVPSFYIRRFTRIWMPWFFVFCLSALCQAFLFRSWDTIPQQSSWFLSFWHASLTFKNVVRQCFFLLHDPTIVLIPQDWSLGLELQVSILLPVLMLICTFGSAWSLAATSLVALSYEPSGCYYAFILGLLLARFNEVVRPYLQPKPLAVKTCLCALGIILYEFPHFWYWVEAHFGTTDVVPGLQKYIRGTTAIGCAFIIAASMASQRIQATLHLPPLLILGRISFSIYLLQFIVLLCVLPAWVHLLNFVGIYRPGLLCLLNIIASVSLTVALSAVNYRWVEKPCIDLGHWLSKKIQQKPVAA